MNKEKDSSSKKRTLPEIKIAFGDILAQSRSKHINESFSRHFPEKNDCTPMREQVKRAIMKARTRVAQRRRENAPSDDS